MQTKHWMSAAAGMLALGAMSATGEAAPLAGTAAGLKTTAAGQTALTEQVRYVRRCWRHRGHVHCKRVYVRPYRYYYGPSYSPGFSLYFGGGHRYGHRRGGHRHHHHR